MRVSGTPYQKLNYIFSSAAMEISAQKHEVRTLKEITT